MAQSTPEKSLDFRVMEIFADILGRETWSLADSQCPESASLILSELGVDSLDLAHIIAQIEGEFDIEIDADSAAKWVAVKDVIAYVRGKLPPTFCQADVDAIVARAKELGAGLGLAFKMGQFKLSNYATPHDASVLAQLIIGGWEEKWDLIHATHALIEFLTKRGGAK